MIYFIIADEGYYQSGRFHFEIDVPEAYNMVVSDLFVRSVCSFGRSLLSYKVCSYWLIDWLINYIFFRPDLVIMSTTPSCHYHYSWIIHSCYLWVPPCFCDSLCFVSLFSAHACYTCIVLFCLGLYYTHHQNLSSTSFSLYDVFNYTHLSRKG